MDDAQELSLDDIVIGAYQELFLKEIEKARRQHNIRVYHTLSGAREILRSYLAEFKGVPGLPSVDQLLAELVKRKLIVVYPDEKIRTRHLELIIRAIYSRSYPNALSALEYVILKPRESPLPSFRERKGAELYEVIKRYFKTFVDEKLAETLSTALVNAFLKSVAGKHNLEECVLSEYQYVNLKSLFEYASNSTPSISLLAAPTGTGKTWIFAIYALARVLEAKIRGESSGVKVIIVYPRKALARDQFERILKLIHSFNEELRQKGLDGYIISIGIWDGDSPEDLNRMAKLREKRGSGELREGDTQAKFIEFRGVACPSCGRAKLVYNEKKKVIECPSCGTIYNYVSDVRKWISEIKPDILITNLWALNHRLISRRYRDLLSGSVRSIVIDEAHALKDLEGAFTSYLLARLLLRLAMQYKGVSIDSSKPLRLDPKAEYDALDWIRDYVKERSFTIILSSATISTAPSEGERRRDAESFVRDHVYPKLYEVFESICKGRGRVPIIYHDYDQLYSSVSSLRKLRRKIDATVIIAPHPARGIETIAQAVALCSLYWSKEFNQKFLLFADKKEAVDRLYHFVKDIIIRDRGEIYDHVFLTRENTASHISDYVRRSWENYGDILLRGDNALTKALDDPLYWLTFTYASYFSSILAKHGDFSKALAYIREKQASHFNALLEIAKNTCKEILQHTYLGFHYADLDKQERQEIEEKFKRADLLGVFSTSTLELGIDIDHISVIIQYRPPKAAENFIQRLGRAGRRPETMYIALGFLLLSNFDTLYLSESYADEALFNVRPRPLPLENSRIIKNAIYYTIIDFIAYLNRLTYYSNKLKHAGIIAKEIQNIYKELTTYEKPLTSIISSLFGLNLEFIRREYELFTKYLEMLYKNLENIETISKPIKNAISDARTELEKLIDLLYEIIAKLSEEERYSENFEIRSLSRRISQAVDYSRPESVDYCIRELNGLDLYYDAYPEYLVRNSEKLLNNMNNCSTQLQNLQSILVDLKQKISYADDTILYQKIEDAVKLLENVESYLGEIVDFLFKNIDFVFAASLKKLLR